MTSMYCPVCGGDHRKAGVAQSCDGPPRNTPDDEAEIAEARAVARQYLDTVARVVQSDVEHLAQLIVCQRRAAAEAEREACAQVVERRARLAESIRPYYLDTHQSDIAAEKTGEAALFRLVARDIHERAIRQQERKRRGAMRFECGHEDSATVTMHKEDMMAVSCSICDARIDPFDYVIELRAELAEANARLSRAYAALDELFGGPPECWGDWFDRHKDVYVDRDAALTPSDKPCEHNWVLDGHNCGEIVCSRCFKTS